MTRQTNSNETTKPDRQNRPKARATMGEISHANPYTGETSGQLFNRGPIVIADGGEANSVEPGEQPVNADEPATETMKSVSHTPPHNADDANAVFERGGSERAEPDADVDE